MTDIDGTQTGFWTNCYHLGPSVKHLSVCSVDSVSVPPQESEREFVGRGGCRRTGAWNWNHSTPFLRS